MSFRKIGPFLQRNSCSMSLRNVPVVKLIDPSVQTIKDMRAMTGPKTIIIVRKFFKFQPLSNPHQEATNWENIFYPYVTAGLDNNIVFEGYNEISEADTAPHAIFEKRRQDFLHGYGYGGVYGNHGVGNLNNENVKPYTSLIANFSDRDFFGWHSYWGTGQTVLNPWHTLRWSLVDMLKDVPGLVTEMGRDYVKDINLASNLWGKRGWKLSGISSKEYREEIDLYGKALDTYPNMAGATLFLVGPCEKQWDNYQAEEVYRIGSTTVTEPYFYFDQPSLLSSPQPPNPPVIPVVDETKEAVEKLLIDLSKQLTEAQIRLGNAEGLIEKLKGIIYEQ